jgi:hypothetical protein
LTHSLNLSSEKLVSKFAFKCNLYRYNKCVVQTYPYYPEAFTKEAYEAQQALAKTTSMAGLVTFHPVLLRPKTR